VKSIRYFTLAALLFSAGAARAADESPFKFEFHGFTAGSLFMQNQNFQGGTGQGLLVAAPAPANNAPCKVPGCPVAAAPATKSGTLFGGDVRESRFVFALSGPQTFGGATPKAYFEGDLFGGTTAAAGSPFIESWLWRIRAAFAELKWSNFTFQAGQHSAQLAIAFIPDSVSHIPNPYTFGAGSVGWRTMGARAFYTIPAGPGNFEIAASVAGPTWADQQNPGASIGTVSSAQASGLPQLELRLRHEGKVGNVGWNLLVDGWYESVDLKGFGEVRPNGVTLADGTVKKTATGQFVEVGGKLTFTPVFVAFNAFTGKGVGHLAGALVQQGEIEDTEFWAQAGVNLTKEFSLSAAFGQAKPKEKDVRNWATVYANAAPKKDNQLIAAQAKYLDGGYAFAVEYVANKTTYLSTATLPSNTKTDAYQIIGTAAYFF
jgi:hypothetical protein